jgi:peptidyl-prolyl cis-trans isomerase A (cyclophilin A)
MTTTRFITSLGILDILLDRRNAALAVSNFTNYIEDGLYDGAVFYRAMRREHWTPGREMELIQGGLAFLPERVGEPVKLPRSPIPHKYGTISMAQDAKGLASSEFFVCLNDCPMLDYSQVHGPERGSGFAAFGNLVSGDDVLRNIHSMETSAEAPIELLRGQIIKSPVLIERAYIH